MDAGFTEPSFAAVGPNAEDALRLAEDALTFHLEGLTAEGIAAPTPRALGDLLNGAAPEKAVLLLLAGRPPKAHAVRVNITLDKNLLAGIDEAAAEAGTTRSGFLAEAARRVMNR
ncbi:MAG: type II toxin-antitoxin system HicB family antitoxin [Proteobacteria bacterium]|nr:type II toxin-antitoxin system HicB family antitoxin [Pseudomonadota bacterium]